MNINLLISAVYVELLKAFRSWVFKITFLGFSIVPIIGVLFVLIVRDPTISKNSPLLEAKANLAGLSADWPGYMGFLNMAVSIGGLIIFGFITSWTFGREYSDKTIKDILTLPLPRGILLTAKYLSLSIWSFLISIWIFLLGTCFGGLADLEGWSAVFYLHSFIKFCHIWLMVTVIGFPVAWFASAGKGYMAPLGFVFFTLALGQIMGALGMGEYTPWAIPGLYSGAGGEANSHLGPFSFVLVYLLGIAGIVATWLHWKNSDQ